MFFIFLDDKGRPEAICNSFPRLVGVTERINSQSLFIQQAVLEALGVLSGGFVPQGVLLLEVKCLWMAWVLSDEFELIHKLSFKLAFGSFGHFVIMNRTHNLFDGEGARFPCNDFDVQQNGKRAFLMMATEVLV